MTSEKTYEPMSVKSTPLKRAVPFWY